MAVGGGGSVGSSNPVKIMANIFISFIGAGVLGLPFAFKEAGILEGILIMTLVGFISVKAMLLIIDCKYKLIEKDQYTIQNPKYNKVNSSTTAEMLMKVANGTLEENNKLLSAEENEAVVSIDESSKPPAPRQDLTYGDVGYYAVGHMGRFLVEMSIIISQIGFCCAYLIFISENLSDYITGLTLVHWLLILLPPLSLLTLLRHLNSLALSSLFAQLSNLLAFAVVFWFDFDHFHKIEIHPKKMSLKGFPFFLAVSIYCYEGAGMILALESSLAEKIRHQFRTYFKGTLVIVTLLYISFGACGYLSFGAETNPIITLNLPKGSSLDFAIMVKSCLCLALFFTYPVMMFPVINILEKKLLPNAGEKIWYGNMLRFFMVTLTGAVVLAVPNFANLMALVGATCCTMLAFILPGVFHLQIFKGSITRWQWCMDLFLIFLGVIGCVVGTMDALIRLGEVPSELDGDSELIEMFLDNTGNLTQDVIESAAALPSTLANLTSI